MSLWKSGNHALSLWKSGSGHGQCLLASLQQKSLLEVEALAASLLAVVLVALLGAVPLLAIPLCAVLLAVAGTIALLALALLVQALLVRLAAGIACGGGLVGRLRVREQGGLPLKLFNSIEQPGTARTLPLPPLLRSRTGRGALLVIQPISGLAAVAGLLGVLGGAVGLAALLRQHSRGGHVQAS